MTSPPVLFAQAFVPGMAAVGCGRIVRTGSSVTLHPQTRDLAYITSKGCIHALRRGHANELGEFGHYRQRDCAHCSKD
jgi:NAD(P)-dependent dehydrogenase (short-subunit alcohol dehydrogenase family)